MGKTDMRDTDYLFQPRGQGTEWCFRMTTPKVLLLLMHTVPRRR